MKRTLEVVDFANTTFNHLVLEVAEFANLAFLSNIRALVLGG